MDWIGLVSTWIEWALIAIELDLNLFAFNCNWLGLTWIGIGIDLACCDFTRIELNWFDLTCVALKWHEIDCDDWIG